MKRIIYLFLMLVTMALDANALVTVCGVTPDESGHFNSPFIKSGSITWDNDSKTLTLNNAVVEYSTDNKNDNIHPIRLTEDATIVIHGDCQLTTNGYVAMRLQGSSSIVTIQGDGSLSLESTWYDIFVSYTQLTIKDITLKTSHEIADNSYGRGIVLTFDNVSADITGGVYRIGESINFVNCSITEPAGAYVDHEDYGYFIAHPDGGYAYHIVISPSGNKRGDVNLDNKVDIADAVSVLNAMAGQPVAGDANVNGDYNESGDPIVDIADLVTVLNIMAGQ